MAHYGTFPILLPFFSHHTGVSLELSDREKFCDIFSISEKFWSNVWISLYVPYIQTFPSAQNREVSQLRAPFSPKSPPRLHVQLSRHEINKVFTVFIFFWQDHRQRAVLLTSHCCSRSLTWKKFCVMELLYWAQRAHSLRRKRKLQVSLYEAHHEKTCLWNCMTRLDSNRPAQLQKQNVARGLDFQIKKLPR